ncbi:TIGR03089 family protein [Cellulomonas xylanilytica]|uniref:TIGR03089 family protein n=1 Tax=Cellulomonas xylanilytica TaxID=233583 RepID=A0A510V434_9CELL|nr:TIGR03089 family protein [Cellulomonas xylanilytica]GEK21628.1 TIGR03089 family protein [Cellulomonas xylanilytica]
MPLTTTADLLRLLTREPGRPRLTWYGDGGERVELSGAVLENWVSKTANLLLEEFDAEPGTRVRLDLPGHWRTVVWALAAWHVGATVVVGADGAADDVVVTDRPDEHPGAPTLVAVALPALARTFGAPLPGGAIDAASAVMTYGDAFGGDPRTGAQARLDTAADGSRTIGQVLEPDASATAGARELLTADPRGAAATLVRACTVLAGAGSVVLVSAEVAGDPGRLARLRHTERVSPPS